MSKNILDKIGNKVGTITPLEGGDYAVNFHGVYVGVFSSFEGWNADHGLVYKLEGMDYMNFDIDLSDEWSEWN